MARGHPGGDSTSSASWSQPGFARLWKCLTPDRLRSNVRQRSPASRVDSCQRAGISGQSWVVKTGHLEELVIRSQSPSIPASGGGVEEAADGESPQDGTSARDSSTSSTGLVLPANRPRAGHPRGPADEPADQGGGLPGVQDPGGLLQLWLAGDRRSDTLRWWSYLGSISPS